MWAITPHQVIKLRVILAEGVGVMLMYCWKMITLLFSSPVTGWFTVLHNLVLQAHALDRFPQDQHVNTLICLASTVTNSSAFCIKGRLTTADLLTTSFIGVLSPVAVLQNYPMPSDLDINVSH